MTTLKVCETFLSIQGESTFAGLPCHFIRLAGCNLHCTYCDTPQARQGGREVEIERLVEEAVASRAAIVEITGGEPLLQPNFTVFARALQEALARPILVETNGSLDISAIPAGVIAVMDIKCPGSGMADAFDIANLDRLRPQDEVKFVICGRSDYDWARRFVEQYDVARRCRAVLFSPATGRLKASMLAEWMIEDCPPARLQVRLQHVLGVR